MKRIFTSAAILIALFNTSQLQAQCVTNAGVCDNVIDDYSTDPSGKNYDLMGWIYTGTEASGQHLRIPSAAPASNYNITTPAYYLTYAGVVNVGFTLSTWPGSNNYFTIGDLDLTIEVINATTNTTITSCSGNNINAAGSYCFQIADAGLYVGTMIRYRFIFGTSENVPGTRVINFDNLAVSSTQQATLPVTFMAISGTKVTEGNKISWSVGTESNVNRYEIEESSNGKSFTLIGQVNATGSSNYSFIDIYPGTATTYYRVKSKDNDGYTKISPVISVKATSTKGGRNKIALGAYPTLTSGEITVSYDEADQNSVLSIMSVDGRMVKSFVPSKGSIQTTLNISSYQPGMYFIRYQAADGEVETIKIVKQ